MKNTYIDFHCHIRDKSSVDEIIQLNFFTDIKKSVICSGNMLDSSRIGDFLRGSHPINTLTPNNDLILDIYKYNPEYFYPFFTIDPDYHIVEDILNALNKGFCGLKLNPIIHNVDFLSSSLLEILESVEDKTIPIYTHITLSKESNLESLLQLSKKFENLFFIIGHMGFSTSDFSAIDACERRKNIYLETSIGSRLAFLEIKKRDMVSKLIFGSEYPLHDPRVELYKLQLIFNESELNDICYKNADRILRKSFTGEFVYDL